jgi:hypothetical protein
MGDYKNEMELPEEANILKLIWEPDNLGLKYWTDIWEEGSGRFELH